MKKQIQILVLSSVISSAIFVTGSVAFAQTSAEKEELTQKVYYSESLGVDGEQRVFQVTSCAKMAAKAPLRCSSENAGEYEQCTDPKTGKIRDGKIIQGCVKKEADADNPYPTVDPHSIVKTGPPNCPAEKIAPYYVDEWAVIESKSTDARDWIVQGYVAWPGEEVPESVVKSISKSENARAVQFFRTAYCSTQDFPEKNGSVGSPESVGGVATKTQKELNEKTSSIAQALIKAGCNNSNAAISDEDAAEFGVPISTSFHPFETVVCSTKYRVSGGTGVQIFSGYVRLLYTWAASIVGIVAVLTIVYNGIIISVSGGGETTEAKERIMQSLVGIAILFLSGLILYTINPNFFTN